MVTTFAGALMGVEGDAVCGAPFGERTNMRNGYRRPHGTVALQHPSGQPAAKTRPALAGLAAREATPGCRAGQRRRPVLCAWRVAAPESVVDVRVSGSS